MTITVEGRENDIVAVAHSSIERHPGEEFAGLALQLQTRDGKEIRLRITTQAAQSLLNALTGNRSMLGLSVAPAKTE